MGYQVYVRCDHVSPADVKMGRANEIEVVTEQGLFEPCMFIHMCNSCKATLGYRFAEVAVM